MKIAVWTLFLFFAMSLTYRAAAQLQLQHLEKQGRTRIYVDRVILGFGVDTTLLSASKIRPALNYITTMLTNKYELASDSAVFATQSKLENPTAFDIAQGCFADKVFVVQVEQLWNVIRVEIFVADVNKPDEIQSFTGLAVLHLFKKSDDMPVFDPTILEATQRAFASFAGDSLMFMENIEPYNVKPAPGLVIASVEFINDAKYTFWEVFNTPVLTSYEYIETIYEEIHRCPDWVVFDATSRDAIYSQFNLFGTENNIAPSYNELAAMKNFQVEHYITGKIQRNKNGITITLSLNEYKPNNNANLSDNIIKSVTKNVYKNNILDTQKAIKELAKKLVFE